MRAVVSGPDNVQASDVDHIFVTQAIASANIPPVTVTEVPGSTPQSGIELLDLIDENRPASTLAA
ncbi:MAG: hypothetical protein ACRD4Y_18195, partial [Candidatus Acidiferrales bacterium]